MSITVSQLQSHLDTARTKIGQSDWDGAETELLQAQAVLSGLPNSSDVAGNSLDWRETISSLLKTVRRKRGAKKASQGFQSKPIEYERPEVD